MKCRDNEIQELLPAYQQQLLSPDERTRVEQHLALCGECSKELTMLGVLADDAVPDPGEAFWAALPGRIFRDVAEQERRKRSRSGSFLPDWLLPPRWIWTGSAAAMVLIVAVAAWFLVRPRPVEIASKATPDRILLFSTEDTLDAEAIDMAELDNEQLDSLGSWASRELAALGEGPEDLFTSGFDASTDVKIAELNEQELENLSNNLDEYDEEYEEEG